LPFIVQLLEDAGLGKEARVLMLGCGNSALGEVVSGQWAVGGGQ
jgi:hypothetical protein